jgi:hypothetical protein
MAAGGGGKQISSASWFACDDETLTAKIVYSDGTETVAIHFFT